MRAREADGRLVSTSLRPEIREDGTLGQVMTKSCLDFNSIQRYGSPKNTDTYFLCSPPARDIFYPLENKPADRRALASAGELDYARDGSTASYVGDGWIADYLNGTLRLVRPLGLGEVVTPEEYLNRTAAERRKLTIVFPPEALPSLLGGVSEILPLGWKNENEGYVFAVVSYSGQRSVSADGSGSAGVAAARVAIVTTRTLTVQSKPATTLWPSISGTGPNSALAVTPVACTGPGQMEFIAYRRDIPTEVVEDRVAFFYQSWWFVDGVRPASSTSPAIWPSLSLQPAQSPQPAAGPELFVHAGEQVTTTFSYKFTTYSPRPIMAVRVRSSDFGATWTVSDAAELDDNIPSSGTGGGSVQKFSVKTTRGDGSEAPQGAGPDAFYTVVVDGAAPVQKVTTVVFPSGPIEFYSYSSAQPAPTYYSIFDGGLQGANRSRDVAPALPGLIVYAGSVTFAVVGAYLPRRSLEITPLTPGFISDTRVQLTGAVPNGQLGEATSNPQRFPDSFRPSVMRMYVSSQGGAYGQVKWPADSDSFPREPLGIFPALRSGQLRWASAGDGCAMFAFPNALVEVNFDDTPEVAAAPERADTLILVATTNAGSSWTTRRIRRTNRLAQCCLLASEDGGPASFLISVAVDERFQVYKLSADLAVFEPYSGKYAEGNQGQFAPVTSRLRPGLINFRDHVHPGFPGVFDEPEAP